MIYKDVFHVRHRDFSFKAYELDNSDVPTGAIIVGMLCAQPITLWLN